MTTSELITSEQDEQVAISHTVEKLSSSSNQVVLFPLKVVEYLSLTAFICAIILTRILPENQRILIFGVISLSIFLFLFLVNRQLFMDARNTAK